MPVYYPGCYVVPDFQEVGGEGINFTFDILGTATGGSGTAGPADVWIHNGTQLTKGPVGGVYSFEVNPATGNIDVIDAPNFPQLNDAQFDYCIIDPVDGCESNAGTITIFAECPSNPQIALTVDPNPAVPGETVTLSWLSDVISDRYEIQCRPDAQSAWTTLGVRTYNPPGFAAGSWAFQPTTSNEYRICVDPADWCGTTPIYSNIVSTVVEIPCEPVEIWATTPAHTLEHGDTDYQSASWAGSGPFGITLQLVCPGKPDFVVWSQTGYTGNSATYDYEAGVIAHDQCSYRWTIGNQCSSDQAESGVLTVVWPCDPPVITQPYANQSLQVGDTLTNATSWTGTNGPIGPLMYSTITKSCPGEPDVVDGPNLVPFGQTTSVLNYPIDIDDDGCTYTLLLENDCGSASTSMTVTVTEPECLAPAMTAWPPILPLGALNQTTLPPISWTGGQSPFSILIEKECNGVYTTLYSTTNGMNGVQITIPTTDADDGCTIFTTVTTACGAASTIWTILEGDSCTPVAGCITMIGGAEINDFTLFDPRTAYTACNATAVDWSTVEIGIPTWQPAPWGGQVGTYPMPSGPNDNHLFSPYEGFWSTRASDGIGIIRFSPLPGFCGPITPIVWRVRENGVWSNWGTVKGTIPNPPVNNNSLHYQFDASMQPYLTPERQAAFDRVSKFFNCFINGPAATTQGFVTNGICADICAEPKPYTAAMAMTEFRGAWFASLPKRSKMIINTGSMSYLDGNNPNGAWLWDQVLIHELLHGFGFYNDIAVSSGIWDAANYGFTGTALAEYNAAIFPSNVNFIPALPGDGHHWGPPMPDDAMAGGSDPARVEVISRWIAGFMDDIGWTVDYSKTNTPFNPNTGWAQP